jgi:hypothetical protein
MDQYTKNTWISILITFLLIILGISGFLYKPLGEFLLVCILFLIGGLLIFGVFTLIRIIVGSIRGE